MRVRKIKWMSAVLCALLGTAYGCANYYQPVVVSGSSMAPTLHGGQVLFADRTYYRANSPSRGDVVVFEKDGQFYVKRIYRGPREKFGGLVSGSAWLNLVRREHLKAVREELRNAKWAHYRLREQHVPQGHVFVVGDNYLNSEDSRDFGPIPISSIVGRVVGMENDTTAIANFEWQLRPFRSQSYRQALHARPDDRG